MLQTVSILTVGALALTALVVCTTPKVQAADPCCIAPSNTTESVSAAPLVCTLTDEALQVRRAEVVDLLSAYAQHVHEHDNGYSIAFENGHAKEIVEFIELERACCTFFEFTLTFPPEHGSTVLSITGPAGSKSFLRGLFDAWSEHGDD